MADRTTSGVAPAEAELLRAHVLGRDRTWIIAHPEHRLTSRQHPQLRQLLRRRARGQPLAYLIGWKEFFGNKFMVGRGVLVPRPETEQLVEIALARIPVNRQFTIADIGTGSGCVAVSIARRRPLATIIATDISPVALRFAWINARLHRLLQRTTLLRGRLLNPVLRSHLNPDLIVANLPYAKPAEYRSVRAEPRRAIVGGRDGLSVFREFFRQCREFKTAVPIILEVDPRRWRRVKKLALSVYPSAEIVVKKDLAGYPRVIAVDPILRPGANDT